MRLLRRALWALALAAVVGAAAALLAIALAWESTPRVVGTPVARAQPLLQLREMWRRNDPRRAEPGRLYVLTASPEELALLVGHAAGVLGGAAETALAPGRLTLRASLPLPWHPPGGWLNLTVALADGAGLPHIEHVTVGRLPVPGWAARPLVELAARWLDPGSDDAPPLRHLARGVRLTPERAQLVYEWRADVPARLFARVMPAEQQARLQVYHARLAEVLRANRRAQRVPVLLQAMFTLARQRADAGEDAVAENRAALLTLALYATGRPLTRAMPQARSWPRLPWRPVVLRDRIDFAQHYLVSAAIAARAGGALADVLGLAKEVSDARDGSGFSFNDLAVNRAGVRLGEQAVADPARLQAALATGLADADLVPDVSDLPQFLSEAAFVERYGGLGAPAYEAMAADIEARIAALPLWSAAR